MLSDFRKLGASLINIAIILALAWPFTATGIDWRLASCGLCFSYCVACELLNGHRCIGMMVMGTVYEARPSVVQSVAFSAGYTVSWLSVVYHLWVPLDLFFANGFLQAACIRRTGTTIHGYFAGVRTCRP